MNNNYILYWGVLEQIVNALCLALIFPTMIHLLVIKFKMRQLYSLSKYLVALCLLLWFFCCPFGDYIKTLAWLTERWYYSEYGDGLVKSFSYYAIYNIQYSFILATIGFLMCIYKSFFGIVTGLRCRYNWIALASLLSILIASAILIESPSAKEYRDAWTAYKEQQEITTPNR